MGPTNLLVLMSDEHHPRFMGCAGHPVVRTPHLDALAARGTRFANGYTNNPICVPARASMATGRYPYQVECWDNAAPYVGQAPSWGHRLTARGQTVTTIGKLHFRDPADDTGFPDQRIPLHLHEGVGDLFGMMRDRCPTRPNLRGYIEQAGPGESEYLHYDRGIAAEAARWLRDEAHGHDRPWALWVSFVNPHIPLIASPEYWELYPPDSVVLPTNWDYPDWPRHPQLALKRRIEALEEPFDEATLRRGIAAYYANCTFMDAQLGLVLRALEAEGFLENTRVVYTADHGDMVGEHGLWYKCCMYEGSVGTPMIVAGPDVPQGNVSETNVSLVDIFPSVLDATGVQPEPEDADLPGGSLWELARQEGRRSRTVFADYYAMGSANAIFMLRGDRYKYVHHVGLPPQLFDMLKDPTETRDLAEDPAYRPVLETCERELRSMVDPEALDRRSKEHQRLRLEAHGGEEAIRAVGPKFTHSPPPAQFADDPAVAIRG